ncbi:MAG: substrate-binding domain-containing protein [Rhodospirillales bacterium]|nr:substrate-binding domain-containing protein [Rhodospirillales bacterium]
MRTIIRLLAGLATTAALLFPAHAADKYITVASTTSTEQSGLFGHLLPKFTAKTGIEVRVIAQGTGQALKTGRQGDADVLFVHDPVAEKKFVEEGYGVGRREVMYNDFVVVGPKSDPAGVKGAKSTAEALKRIADAQAGFASRGDKSGTHAAELRHWKAAGVDVAAASGSWYRETGSGMGPTLNTAAAMEAYSLTDRGTWLNFKNRKNLEIVFEGDPSLFNQYGVILVNPDKHAHVKKDMGQTFMNWLTSAEGQQTIADYKINGEQLFFPNYKPGS